MTQKVKLAEALLRRKELTAKVQQLASIKDRDLYEVKGKRQKIAEDVDDIILQVPLLSSSEVTAAYDWHAKQLRLVDAAIQQVNWTAEVELGDTVMADYEAVSQVRSHNGKSAK